MTKQKLERNLLTLYYLILLAKHTGESMQFFHHDDAGIYGFTLGGQKYIFERNILGDVYAIYNASTGQWVGRYFYRAHGELLGMHVNPDYPGATAVMNLNPIRWRGKYYDIDLGFYYMNSRWYDPQTGRFINSDDPVMLLSEPFLAPASGTNLFMYAYNNPIMFRDDSGYGLFTAVLVAVGKVLYSAIKGAVVGAAVAGGVYTAVEVGSHWATGEWGWNWNDFGESVMWGAIVGGASGGFGLVGANGGRFLGISAGAWQIGGQMAISAGVYVTQTLVSGGQLSITGFALSLAGGYAAGTASSTFARSVSITLGLASADVIQQLLHRHGPMPRWLVRFYWGV